MAYCRCVVNDGNATTGEKTMYTMEDIESRFKQVTGITADMTVFPITDGTGAQQKTDKKDVRKYGYVTTPLDLADSMVVDMIEKTAGCSYEELPSSDGMEHVLKDSYIDLCCGCGQFGIRILRAVVNATRGMDGFSLQQFLRGNILFAELNPECVARAIYVFHGDLNIMIGDARKLNTHGETEGLLFYIDGKWQRCEDFTDAVNRILSSGSDWQTMVDQIASEIRNHMDENGAFKKKTTKIQNNTCNSEKMVYSRCVDGTSESVTQETTSQTKGESKMNETTVEAVVKAMKTVATSVLKVDDAYKSQMAQSVRILADVLEQATRETKTVEQVVEKKEEPVVETPVVEEVVETKTEEPVVEEPVVETHVVETKKEEPVALVRTRNWNPHYKWIAKGVVRDELIGKPELKTGELDAVDTVITQETMASIFGANKTLEVHFMREGGKSGKKLYCVEHCVDIPVEDLMNRKWTRKRVSNVHKQWVQTYTTTSGSFTVTIDMNHESNGDVIMYALTAGDRTFLKRKSDGKIVSGSLIDGLYGGYDEKKYDYHKFSVEDFATMCGVQTVWDARNVA